MKSSDQRSQIRCWVKSYRSPKSSFLTQTLHQKKILKSENLLFSSQFLFLGSLNKNNLYDAHLMCFFILYKGVSKPCNNINWSLCHTPAIETPKVTFICKKCSKLRYLLNCKGNLFRNGKNPKIIWA